MSRLRDRRVALVLGTSLGGVGAHVGSLVSALTEAGAVATVHGPAATEQTFAFSARGAEFRTVPIASGFAPVAANRAATVLAPQLVGADVVHAHGLRAGLVAASALRRTRRAKPTLVVTWHNVPNTTLRWRQLQTRLERRLALAADVTLAVSPDLVDRLHGYGSRDVRLAPAGAEPLPTPARDLSHLRAALNADDRPIIAGIGRLHEQKGFDVLLQAAAGWSTRQPPPLLVVAGDGPERERLHAQAAAGAVEVRWLGFVTDRQRIADLLAAADVVVVPSRWEGSPLAVQEALTAGRPVVTTPVGGLPALLRQDEVAFVPADDAAAVAAAVGELLDHPDRAHALAVAGRRGAGRWPDARAAAAAVLDVYVEVLPR